MSHVRMCDKDGTIFPEGAEGSGTGQVTNMVRDERTGRTYPDTKNIDICPMCNAGNTVTPRLAIAGSADRIAMANGTSTVDGA